MVSKQDKLEKAEHTLDSIKTFLKRRAAVYSTATKLEDLIKLDLPPYLKRATGGNVQGFSMNYSDQDNSIHERYIFRTNIIDFNKLKGKLNGKMYMENSDTITFEKAEFGNTEVKLDTIEVAEKVGSKDPPKIKAFELFDILAESLITPKELAEQIDDDNKAGLHEQNKENEGNGTQDSEDKGMPSDTET
jgi:hypothetical protein